MRARLPVAASLAIILLGGAACGSQTSGAELAERLENAVTAAGREADQAAPAPEAVPETTPTDSTDPAGTASPPVSGAAPSASAPPATAAGSAPKSAGSARTASAGQPAARPAPTAGGTAAPAAPSRPAPAAAPAPARDNAPAPAPAPGPGAGSSPAAAGPCNDQPIAIGSVGQLSGVLGDVFRPIAKGAQMWAAAVNATGGINCHKVTYVTGDDGGDPARHQALVRQFVEKDKVIAFVPMTAPITARASRDYLNQKQIPVVGSEGAEMFFYESPMHFAPYPVDDVLFQAMALLAGKTTVPEGKNKAATLTCQEIEACDAAEKAFKEFGPKAGYDIVYTAKTSLANPDFTSFCIQARNAGADVILGGSDGATYRRAMRDCAKLDYHPRLALASAQAQEVFLQDPVMEGAIVTMPVQPWFYDTPAAQEFRSATEKFGTKEVSNAGLMIGWTAAKAFAAAAATIGPGVIPTPAAVLAGLYAIKDNDLGGLTYPLTYQENQPEARMHCGWVITVGKGEWLSTDRNRTCF